MRVASPNEAPWPLKKGVSMTFYQPTIKCVLCGVAAAMVACSMMAGPASAAEDASPPNVVVIVADDLGYADVGYHGSDIRTPNIDRLADDGVKLERFYVTPICSPTRAGLMTGRWPIRFGMMGGVITPFREMGIADAETTLAEMFAQAGYKHRAAIGKWHLGHNKVKWLPRDQGFTHFYGHYNGNIDYFTRHRNGALDWHRNGQLVHEQGYSTTLFGDEAVDFINQVPKEEPYFLYLPFNAPHRPLQAPETTLEQYVQLTGERKKYAAMVSEMDRAIGRVLNTIEQRGQRDNTLVWFISDNGGVTPYASNAPYRGRKGQVYEGGIRAAAAVRWPNGGLVGGRVCNQKMGYIDVLPTLRAIVSLKDEPALPLDGLDVRNALRGDATLGDRPWFSFLEARGGREKIAIDYKGWKLRALGPPVTDPAFAKKAHVQLFHIAQDPREQHDLADKRPAKVEAMLKRLRAFRKLRPAKHVPYHSVGRSGYTPPDTWQIR
jgi:arylsulfatase A-like enzyme